jgi:hypothetical protein
VSSRRHNEILTAARANRLLGHDCESFLGCGEMHAPPNGPQGAGRGQHSEPDAAHGGQANPLEKIFNPSPPEPNVRERRSFAGEADRTNIADS